MKWNDQQSETRRVQKKYNIDAERSEAGNFLKKYITWALKIAQKVEFNR